MLRCKRTSDLDDDSVSAKKMKSEESRDHKTTQTPQNIPDTVLMRYEYSPLNLATISSLESQRNSERYIASLFTDRVPHDSAREPEKSNHKLTYNENPRRARTAKARPSVNSRKTYEHLTSDREALMSNVFNNREVRQNPYNHVISKIHSRDKSEQPKKHHVTAPYEDLAESEGHGLFADLEKPVIIQRVRAVSPRLYDTFNLNARRASFAVETQTFNDGEEPLNLKSEIFNDGEGPLDLKIPQTTCSEEPIDLTADDKKPSLLQPESLTLTDNERRWSFRRYCQANLWSDEPSDRESRLSTLFDCGYGPSFSWLN